MTEVKRDFPQIDFAELNNTKHKSTDHRDYKTEYDANRKLIELSQSLSKEAEAHAKDVEKYANKLVEVQNQVMQLNSAIAERDQFISFLYSILTPEQTEQVRKATSPQPQGFPQY